VNDPRNAGREHAHQAVATKRRAGGRSTRVKAAVLQAAGEALIERGLEDVSIAEIAAKAGVHETSIYRRWGTKTALIVDAVLAKVERALPIPDTGLLRDDLAQLLRDVAAFLASPFGATLTRMVAGPAGARAEIAAARDTYWTRRRHDATLVFERAIARGEVAPDTDVGVAFETLIGPLYFRALITGEPLDDAFLERLISVVLNGFAVRAEPARRVR
jgi:AcrR family transcriptional regulator